MYAGSSPGQIVSTRAEKGPGKLEAGERERASLLSPDACGFLRKGPAGETARIVGDRVGWDRWGPRTGEGAWRDAVPFPKAAQDPSLPFPGKKNPVGT